MPQKRLLNCVSAILSTVFLSESGVIYNPGLRRSQGPDSQFQAGANSVPNSVPNRKSSPANVKDISSIFMDQLQFHNVFSKNLKIVDFLQICRHLDFPLRDPLLLLLSGLKSKCIFSLMKTKFSNA